MSETDRSATSEATAQPASPSLHAHHRHGAWRSRTAWAVLLAVVVLGLLADLGSKTIAFRTVAGQPVVVDRAEVLAADRLITLIPPHNPVVVVPKVLEFTLVLNPGAVFGAAPGKRWVFVCFTLAAIAFVLTHFALWTHRTQLATHAAIGLIIAGGIGNLYDRLRFACVRDFIHPLPGVHLPFGITWPSGETEIWPYVSNVADLLLIIGIAGLLIGGWRGAKPHPKPTTDEAADPGE